MNRISVSKIPTYNLILQFSKFRDCYLVKKLSWLCFNLLIVLPVSDFCTASEPLADTCVALQQELKKEPLRRQCTRAATPSATLLLCSVLQFFLVAFQCAAQCNDEHVLQSPMHWGCSAFCNTFALLPGSVIQFKGTDTCPFAGQHDLKPSYLTLNNRNTMYTMV